jgi:hypothetical protein
MKPLLKTEWVNLPVSVPLPWRNFFDDYARKLGISRNAALCLALKLGGPILQRYFQVMGDELRDHYESIGRKLGNPRTSPDWLNGDKETPDERRNDRKERSKQRGATPEPGSGQKGR